MAEARMAERRRAVISVRLALGGAAPEVRCTLSHEGGGGGATLADWTCTTEDLALPAHLGARETRGVGHRFACPDYLVEGIAHALAGAMPAGEPLWLALGRPAGYLALLPWERFLAERLGRAVLRVPEWPFVLPERARQRLECVLCSSQPEAKAAFLIEGYVELLAARIPAALDGRVRLHVFVDEGIYRALAARWREEGRLGQSIVLHDPAEADDYAPAARDLALTDRGGRIRNPWLLWMRERFRDTRVDVAHFITHGYMASGRGAIALAESPRENTDRAMARFVGARELGTFLDQTGAFALALSSPPNNFSEMGLRALADTVAQQRPGPVLYHELEGDGECAGVAAHYGFFFGDAGRVPPPSAALIGYGEGAREAHEATSRPRGGVAPAADEVPAWVAASERFFERNALALSREEARRGGADARAARDARRETLDALRALVAKNAAGGDER